MNEMVMNSVSFKEKNSNKIMNIDITDTAKPSIPSIKFIELIIATIINTENIWAKILFNS